MHWKVSCNKVNFLLTIYIIFLYVYNVYNFVVAADVEETDQGDTDSFVQPHITSAALKMQLTLRSMIDLGIITLYSTSQFGIPQVVLKLP